MKSVGPFVCQSGVRFWRTVGDFSLFQELVAEKKGTRATNTITTKYDLYIIQSMQFKLV